MKKFLPIGTVCDLISDSKKYMIIGYNQGGNDYESLSFPIGSTNGLNTTKFNHDSINEIYSLGYKDSESITYISSLNAVSNVNKAFEFDENGVVISDGVNIPLVTNTNTLKFDENGIVISEGETISSFSSQPSTLQFDENGVVVGEKSINLDESNGLKFDENGIVIAEEKKETSPLGNIKFDENGVIVSE